MATAEHPAVTGLLLAGGRSSRMGTDKAQLLWRGVPLLEHMCAILAATGADPVCISGNQPGAIADRWPGCGPIGALASVAEVLDDTTLLVVPVDMPRLSPSLLSNLLRQPAAAASHYENHILPLRLRLDGRTRDALRALMQRPAGERRLRALAEAVGDTAVAIPACAGAQLANANTPQQWQEMHA